MFGNKKLIEQYEARIADLKGQIKDLRSISLPFAQSTAIPMHALEADAILTGKEETYHPSHLSEHEKREIDSAESEADRIFSGTYDHEAEVG